MTGATGPQLRAVTGGANPDDMDQVPRKLRFLAQHPGVQIVLNGYWQAIIPAGTVPREPSEVVITRYDLKVLLDELDKLFGPAAEEPASSPG
jgi:hypothetical protein